MVAVEKITGSMFSEIYRSFLADDDPCSGESDWRPMFINRWSTDQEHAGYALVDRGSIVGILGTIFSERMVNRRRRRFCNLHSWHVREEYRGRGLSLLRPVIAMRDHVLTDFTPTPSVCAINRKLGFKRLNSRLKILLPSLTIGRSRPIAVHDQPPTLESLLDPEDLRLYRDHRELDCKHLLASDGHQTCYVIYSRIVRHWVPYCYVHYVSNQSFFAQHSLRLRTELRRRAGGRYVAVDARQMSDVRLPYSYDLPWMSSQMYRGVDIESSQIDTLYSEVLMLRLSTLFNVGNQLRQFGKRLASRSDRRESCVNP